VAHYIQNGCFVSDRKSEICNQIKNNCLQFKEIGHPLQDLFTCISLGPTYENM
jgi:hypothetical protein